MLHCNVHLQVQFFINLAVKIMQKRDFVKKKSCFFRRPRQNLDARSKYHEFFAFDYDALPCNALLWCPSQRCALASGGVWCVFRFFVWPDGHACMPESCSPCFGDHFKLWISIFGPELTDFKLRKSPQKFRHFSQKLLELKSIFLNSNFVKSAQKIEI